MDVTKQDLNKQNRNEIFSIKYNEEKWDGIIKTRIYWLKYYRLTTNYKSSAFHKTTCIFISIFILKGTVNET